MSLSHAETARLAHQALRLRESGIDSQDAILDIAAPPSSPSSDGTAQSIAVAGTSAHPLTRVAGAVADRLDNERPGPTDPKLVKKLMGSSLTDIWKAWDEATTANLEATLPEAELAKWRKANEAADRKAAEVNAKRADEGLFPVHPYFGHNRHLEGAANAFYDKGREGILNGNIDVVVATIKVVLVDSADYTVNLATHEFLSSVVAGGRVATSPALASKTTTAGVFDAADTSFTAVTGDPSEALILYQSSAVGGGADVADTAQRLIGYIDTATGLPVTPNTGDINVVWDNGANRIFKL